MGILNGCSVSSTVVFRYACGYLTKIIVFIISSISMYSSAESGDSCKKNELPRFSTFEPNYAVYRWAETDEEAIRTHLSFKYDFRPLKTYPDNALLNNFKRFDFYFSYTGEFDFYINSRYSSPVINRINNPALHWRRKVSEVSSVNFSLEHKSNGQSEEVVSPEEIEAAVFAYENKDYHFFDAISRGSNYIGVEWIYKSDRLKPRFHAKAKAYLTSDYDVTWMGDAGKHLSIEDYDRVTLVARSRIGAGEASIDVTLGDKLFDTDSWNIDYVPWIKLPVFYVRYHNGPLYTLSNYTHSENYIGLGIKFVP